MTADSLEKTIKNADEWVAKGGSREQAIFRMLKTILQHEADKESERRGSSAMTL